MGVVKNLRRVYTMSSSLRTLKDVAGRTSNHSNDLIIRDNPCSSGSLIFFGGDVQNLEEVMNATDYKRFAKWSLERTANLLGDQFPDIGSVVVVRPSRYVDISFSCFDNFCDFDENGCPTYVTDTTPALEQIDSLIQSAKLKDRQNLTLIGFSKGCAVLNQVVHEIHNILRG